MPYMPSSLGDVQFQRHCARLQTPPPCAMSGRSYRHSLFGVIISVAMESKHALLKKQVGRGAFVRRRGARPPSRCGDDSLSAANECWI